MKLDYVLRRLKGAKRISSCTVRTAQLTTTSAQRNPVEIDVVEVNTKINLSVEPWRAQGGTMATGMFESDPRKSTHTQPLRAEREYFMEEQFFSGELGWLVVLPVVALIIFSLAIWGLVSGIPDTVTVHARR